MSDITTPMQLASSTPKEAAENIDTSNALGVNADLVKEYKPEFQPEIETLNKPMEATPKVAQFVAQSGEHASLAKVDTSKLSWMEKRINYLSDQVSKIPTADRKINDLSFKKMFNKDKFTENDELELFQLNSDASSRTDYGLGDFTSADTSLVDKAVIGLGFLGQVGRGLVDSVVENKEIVAGSVATGATIGAVGGLGVASVPTAIGGAATGLVYGGLTAMAYDGAVQQMGSTYNVLNNATKEDGTPLNIDEDTKKYISIGVGSAVGALSLVGGRAAVGTVPFISKLISKKGMTQVLGTAENQALKLALTNIGKAGAIGFAEGGSQEYIRVVGEEVGKTFDGSEASFVNGLLNASTKLETLKRVGKAGALNSVATGAFSTVGNVVGYAKNVKKFGKVVENARDVTPAAPQQITGGDGTFTIQSDIAPIKPKGSGNGPKTPIDSSVDVLNFENTVNDITKMSAQTEMKKLAPGQLFQLRKSMLQESGAETIYIDKEDLQKFSDNEEKAAAVRNIIDSDGETQASINAPIQIETHKFLDLVDEYPDASKLAKLTPEGPNSGQAKKYLEDIDAAAAKRKEVLDKLGAKETTPEDKLTLQQALETEQPFRTYPSNEVFGEAEYLKQPTLIEAIDSVFAEGAGKKYKDAQLKARQSVADGINETATMEMNQVIDIVVEEAKDAELQSQLERLENNPNLAIVDKFTKTFEMKPDNRFDSIATATASHAKPGYSPMAIDPRLMTDEQKALYAKDKQLRTHKVFVKGGMSPDDSARLLGINNGDNLLKILSQTPSREDVAAYRAAQREPDIMSNARDSVKLNETAIANAYNDNTANHIAEMQFMKDKQWGDTKTGIKKIALPLPTKEKLRNRAESAVAQTTVGKLNVNQFKVGERKSQRIAVDAVLKNEIEKAFVNKEAAALNSELARAAHIAIGKVNRTIRLARKFKNPDVRRELKDAGHEAAANEILNVFNLTSKKSQVEAGSFQKYVEQALKNGEAVVTIPERLSDVRQSLADMTVEQVSVVGDALANMLHQARNKNKLYTKFENKRILQTIEGLGNALEKQALKNREYDPKKLEIDQNTGKGGTTRALEGVIEVGTHLRRTQNILVSLDNGQDIGLANDMFAQPIKNGNSASTKTAIEVDTHVMKNIIEKFGTKEFEELNTQWVEVPEFKGTLVKGNGKMTKMDLVMMNMHRGNGGNLEAIENHGVSRDTVKKVIERELNDHKYMELTQRIWDVYKSFESRVIDLQKRTTGVDVQIVKAEPIEFTANGVTRTYPGGYFPLKYIVDKVKDKAEQMLGSADVNKADRFRQKFYAQAMTEQGHLEARTGSSRLLDLNPKTIGNGLAQMIHDIHMREPIRDVAKLLSDKKIRETVVKVVGKDGYSNIANNVIAQVNSIESKLNGDAGGAIVNATNYVMSNFSSSHILLKAGSVVIQTTSLPFAISRVPKGTKHFALALAKLPGNFKKMYEFAEMYHAPLRDSREGVEGDIVHKLNEFAPKNKWVKGTDWVRKGKEGLTEAGFNGLQQMDNMTKVIMFHTAYSSAMNGDVESINIGDHDNAVKYASNLVELTTTHSAERNLAPIQREKWIKPFTMFYNDASIVANNIVDQAKQAKSKFGESSDEYKKGNYSGAARAAKQGAGIVAGVMIAATITKMLQSAIRGQDILPFDDEDDAVTALRKSAVFFATSPVETLVSIVPYFRDTVYPIALEIATGKPQKVEPPPMKVVNTFKETATGLFALLDFTEDARDLRDKEKKSFLYSLSYVVPGIPADAIYNYLVKPDFSELPVVAKGEWDKLNDRINKLIGALPSDKASAEEIPADLLKQLEETNLDTGDIPPEMIEQLRQLQLEMNPVNADSSVTRETLDVIMTIESNGEWDAQNPNSTAAGLFQFLTGTWEDLMTRAPELGLTENGRVSSDTTQQYLAMEYLTNENIQRLERNGLEVSLENIYASHFLGGSGAVEVLSQDDDVKLVNVVGKSVMRANGFRPTMKVKDFKRWLTRKISRARQTLAANTEQASVDNNNN